MSDGGYSYEEDMRECEVFELRTTLARVTAERDEARDRCGRESERHREMRRIAEKAMKERDEARAALRRIEWACRDDFDEPYCSVCGAGLDEYPPKGHKPGCIVGAALREGEP